MARLTHRRATDPQTSALGQGYLVLADISGYTAFLTGAELEHAHAIVIELVAVIKARLVPPLRFVKVEGDAIFCYAPASELKDGERLIELIEVCYLAFGDLLLNMARSTTCRCAACSTIDTLDLKFIAHFGSYVRDTASGIDDLAGPDVILAHRLLKNTVRERTGLAAYALFTEACVARFPKAFSLAPHSEKYEALGETRGGVYDLASAVAAMRDARREYVTSADADQEFVIVSPHPPAVVWQYLVDPVQRLRWACLLFNRDPDETLYNDAGRSGVGAKSHCNHGPAEAHREIIDWRPFDYFTCRGKTQVRGHFLPAQPIVETFELLPLGDGTRLCWRSQLVGAAGVSRLVSSAASRLLRRGIRRATARLQAAIEQDIGSVTQPASSPQRTSLSDS